MEKRIIGVEKVLWGGMKIATGLSTAMGGGVIGHFLYSHHLKSVAMNYGRKKGMEGGMLVQEGFQDIFH